MKENKLFIILFVCGFLLAFSACNACAQEENAQEKENYFYFPYTPESESWFEPMYHPYDRETDAWFYPFASIRGMYDDNIYLVDGDEEEDFITTLDIGFLLKPRLVKHRAMFDYFADLNFYADNDDENNYNHNVNAMVGLNFNDFHIDLSNRFRYFSERSGSEDINRVDRTEDFARAGITFDFNKLDLSLVYSYIFNEYRSNDAIGSVNGVPLTYEDLDRDENQAAAEIALKLWDKTSLLLAFDYGMIEHDTGLKSDSDYYDWLVGLRGQPTSKSIIEARFGYRSQDYEGNFDDFDSFIVDGSFIENFTSRDTFRVDFKRITNDTIYTDNVYYVSTYIGANFEHDFTDRVFGSLGASYEFTEYPVATTEGALSAEREDEYWSFGVGLGYRFPNNFVADLKYQFRTRDSNFPVFDYDNNRFSGSLTGHF